MRTAFAAVVMLASACSGTIDVQLPSIEDSRSYAALVAGPNDMLLRPFAAFTSTTPGVLVDVAADAALYVAGWRRDLASYEVDATDYASWAAECDPGRPLPTPRGMVERRDDTFVSRGMTPVEYDEFVLPDLDVGRCAERGRCVVAGDEGAVCLDDCPGGGPVVAAPQPPEPPMLTIPPDCPDGTVAFADEMTCAAIDECPADVYRAAPNGAVFVDPTSSGGNGSRMQPFGSVADALQSNAAVVMLAKGRHVATDVPALGRAVTLLGACSGETILEGSFTTSADLTFEHLRFEPSNDDGVRVANGHVTFSNVDARPRTHAIVAMASDVLLERVTVRGGMTFVLFDTGSTVSTSSLAASDMAQQVFGADSKGQRSRITIDGAVVRRTKGVLSSNTTDLFASRVYASDLGGGAFVTDGQIELRDIVIENVHHEGATGPIHAAAAIWAARADDEPTPILERVVIRGVRGIAIELADGVQATDVDISAVRSTVEPREVPAIGMEFRDTKQHSLSRVRFTDIQDENGMAISIRCRDPVISPNTGIVTIDDLIIDGAPTGLCFRQREFTVRRAAIENVGIALDMRGGNTIELDEARFENWSEAGISVAHGAVVASSVAFVGGRGPAIRVAAQTPTTRADLQVRSFEAASVATVLEVFEPLGVDRVLRLSDGVVSDSGRLMRLPCGVRASEIVDRVHLADTDGVERVD